MADLDITVARFYGRSALMAQPVSLVVVIDQEILRIPDTLTRSITLLVTVPAESIRAVANTITRSWNNTGEVAFVASPDHATLTGYTARVRVYGSATIVATQALGVPTPDGNGVIVVSLTATYAGLSAGTYTVSIAATDSGGTTDSTESNAFTLPIA